MQLPLAGTEAVDELLEAYPQASAWLARRGIICSQCGEVFWGSLKDLCTYRKLDDAAYGALLLELNDYLGGKKEQPE